jgi:hypothetical protein
MNTATNTIEIRFTLASMPSHSKGWARYKADANGSRLIESRTGNEWVSAPHAGQAAEGAEIIVTTQTMLRSGKGRTAKETTATRTYRMVAEAGATARIGPSFGGNTIAIDVTNARMIGEVE